jgi:hypothetical protein
VNSKPAFPNGSQSSRIRSPIPLPGCDDAIPAQSRRAFSCTIARTTSATFGPDRSRSSFSTEIGCSALQRRPSSVAIAFCPASANSAALGRWNQSVSQG